MTQLIGLWLYHWQRFWAWRVAREQTALSGVWRYEINEYTGERLAVRVNYGCYQPVDIRWLEQGNGYVVIGGSK